jgi:hypothetical protein
MQRTLLVGLCAFSQLLLACSDGSIATGGVGAGATGGSTGVGGSSGAAGTGAAAGQSGTAGSTPAGPCASPRVRITEIDVGATVVANEDEATLKPLAIAPIPSGGSRVAWMGNDSRVHVTTLEPDDTVDASAPGVAIAASDYGDLYADDRGGVLLVKRDAKGGGTLNCGNPTNLCRVPDRPEPCFDMYLVRFDAAAETWATQLTQANAAHPPYLNGRSDPDGVTFIWWYAHHGRIVSNGSNYAAYYGAANSVSQGGCVNIHQGDQMRVVGPSGAIQPGGFDWGCSHSGYERIAWDANAKKFVTICKNDAPTSGKSGRLAFAPRTTTIYPVDLWYGNVGNLVPGASAGYWLTTSDIRNGQRAGADGLADTLLLHFTTGAPDKNIVLASPSSLNARAPHLAAYSKNLLLAAWETSSALGDLRPNDAGRKLYIQVLDASNGAAVSAPAQVSVKGNRYYEFKAFPDGSVAYAAPGSSTTKLKILRVLPCQG